MTIGWLFTGPFAIAAAEEKSLTPAQGNQPEGRVAVRPSAALGPSIVGLKVDGERTARITYNRRYEEPLAAEEQVLTVYPVVSYQGARPTQRQVKVEPGKTYTFIAVREDIELHLRWEEKAEHFLMGNGELVLRFRG